MKVVITVEEFDPSKGYLEYYLAKELTKLKHRIFVFTFCGSKTITRKELEEGFEVINFPYIATVNKAHVPTPQSINYIIKFIKAEKPDIVHCQPLSSPLSLLITSFERLFHYKVVGSLITGEYSIDNIVKKVGINFIRIVAKRYSKDASHLVFAKSDELKNILVQLFDIPTHMIHIIPLGADPELFRYDAAARKRMRTRLNLSTKDTVITYSGKIIPSKGLDALVKALAPLIKQDCNIKLLIVGAGNTSCLRDLKDLVSNLELSNNVIFHPWVNRTRLPDFYSASEIAVWPGSPSISIVEAASVGLPLIVEKSPIESYATQNRNGFTFRKGDIAELREHLNTLVHNRKLSREMGRKSRLLVEQKLNWKTIAHEYLDTYQKIIHA